MLRVSVRDLAWLAPFAIALVLSCAAVKAADPGEEAAKPAAPEAATPAQDAAPPAAADGAASAADQAPAAPGAAKKPKAPPRTVGIVYLGKAYPEPIPLSLMEPILKDKGVQGARLGIKDNNVTGSFLGVETALDEHIVPADGDVVAEAKKVLADGDKLIVADLEPADLLAVGGDPDAARTPAHGDRLDDVQAVGIDDGDRVVLLIADENLRGLSRADSDEK